MIFDGYENYITERVIDLSRYIGEGGSTDKFHENFFNEEDDSFFDKDIIKTIFGIFGTDNQDEKHGLIDQLQEQDITHILLIIPQKFINNILTKKKKESKVRIRPREFTESFINKFSEEFSSNDIGCSLIVSGSRSRKNTESLEQWLNIRELQKSLKLNTHEAYLLGFRELKLDSETIDNAISIELNKKSLTIKEGCSALLGNHPIFRFNTSTQTSIIKITNNAMDNYIDFITENIELVKSTNNQLQEEYFDSESFDDFGVNLSDLQEDDIDITFDKTTIILSNTIPTPTQKTEDKPASKKRPQQQKPTKERTIGTDTDSRANSSSINLKNRYLVNINRFVTPYEDGLVEVHYHLVKIANRLILVGGSQIDKKENPIAKVVANITNGEIEVTNLGSSPIEFKIGENKIEYKARKTTPKPKQNYIDTDEDEEPQTTQEVSIGRGDSYSFDKKIEFTNSAIGFIEDGIEVRYINFTIGSFNNKLEFNRHYYCHFNRGNIIDSSENLDNAGRLFEDGSKKILGSKISRNSLLVTLRTESFNISNSINEKYSIAIKTPNIKQELSYQEEQSISKDDFLSQSNTLSINRDGIALVEITIIQN
jgi:hypothetical protein